MAVSKKEIRKDYENKLDKPFTDEELSLIVDAEKKIDKEIKKQYKKSNLICVDAGYFHFDKTDRGWKMKKELIKRYKKVGWKVKFEFGENDGPASPGYDYYTFT